MARKKAEVTSKPVDSEVCLEGPGEVWISANLMCAAFDIHPNTISKWKKRGLTCRKRKAGKGFEFKIYDVVEFIKNRAFEEGKAFGAKEIALGGLDIDSAAEQAKVRYETARKLKMANDIQEGLLSETQVIAEYLLVIARSAKIHGEMLERAHGRAVGDDIREFFEKISEDCNTYSESLSNQ